MLFKATEIDQTSTAIKRTRSNLQKMKNHIDTNFAIAIIVLVAACVGISYWIDHNFYTNTNSPTDIIVHASKPKEDHLNTYDNDALRLKFESRDGRYKLTTNNDQVTSLYDRSTEQTLFETKGKLINQGFIENETYFFTQVQYPDRNEIILLNLIDHSIKTIEVSTEHILAAARYDPDTAEIVYSKLNDSNPSNSETKKYRIESVDLDAGEWHTHTDERSGFSISYFAADNDVLTSPENKNNYHVYFPKGRHYSTYLDHITVYKDFGVDSKSDTYKNVDAIKVDDRPDGLKGYYINQPNPPFSPCNDTKKKDSLCGFVYKVRRGTNVYLLNIHGVVGQDDEIVQRITSSFSF